MQFEKCNQFLSSKKDRPIALQNDVWGERRISTPLEVGE